MRFNDEYVTKAFRFECAGQTGALHSVQEILEILKGSNKRITVPATFGMALQKTSLWGNVESVTYRRCWRNLTHQTGLGATTKMSSSSASDLWEATPKSWQSNDLWAVRPKFNPPKDFRQRIFNNLALSKITDYTVQLVDNTIVTSLITQRSVVQIHPPQPIKSTTYR